MTFDVEKFFDYFTAGDWFDSKGNEVRNWKQKMITWQNKEIHRPVDKKKNKMVEKERKYTEEELEQMLLNRGKGDAKDSEE